MVSVAKLPIVIVKSITVVVSLLIVVVEPVVVVPTVVVVVVVVVAIVVPGWPIAATISIPRMSRALVVTIVVTEIVVASFLLIVVPLSLEPLSKRRPCVRRAPIIGATSSFPFKLVVVFRKSPTRF